jgi:hypothetical protein
MAYFKALPQTGCYEYGNLQEPQSRLQFFGQRFKAEISIKGNVSMHYAAKFGIPLFGWTVIFRHFLAPSLKYTKYFVRHTLFYTNPHRRIYRGHFFVFE